MAANWPVSIDDRKSYLFHGRFVPVRANINLNYQNIAARLTDREIRFSIFSFGSEFNGTVLSSVSFENITDVHSVVSVLLRSILDRLSYLNMCGYDFDISGAMSVDGKESQIFGVYEPVLFPDFDQQGEHYRSEIPFFGMSCLG